MNKLLLILLLLGMVSCNQTYFSGTVVYDVNQNRYEKVIRLDLSHQNLTELPTDIEKYSHLNYINLSNNPNLNLKKIFDVLAKFPTLKILILDSNSVKVLPENIKQIASLKHVSLVYNPTIKLEKTFNQLQQLPLLTVLNLSHNNITELPSNITTLVHLKNIRLSHNKIKKGASYSRLSHLKKLKYVWLDNNEITVLPNEVGELTQISELYLGNNNIKTLPNEINNCREMCVLYLGNNQFTELPKQIIDMRIMYMLVIYGNQIATISETFKKTKTPLAILVLDDNYLDKEQQKIAKKYFTGFFLLSLKNQSQLKQ